MEFGCGIPTTTLLPATLCQIIKILSAYGIPMKTLSTTIFLVLVVIGLSPAVMIIMGIIFGIIVKHLAQI